MSDEIIEDYIITEEWGEDNALIFPITGEGGGGSTPAPSTPAQFGPSVTRIFGTIGGAQWGPMGEAFSCAGGVLTVPLPAAAEFSSGSITRSSAGLISGVEFSKKETNSAINSGAIILAAANAASRCNGTVDGTPGGIHGIGYSTDGSFSIDKGFLNIPKPAGHSFDSEWFTVRSDGTVTFNVETLARAVVDEINALNVNVHVEVDDVPIEPIINNAYTVIGDTVGDLAINTSVSIR